MRKWLTALATVAILVGAAPLAGALPAAAIPAPGLTTYEYPKMPGSSPAGTAQQVHLTGESEAKFQRSNGPAGGAMSVIKLSPLYPIDSTIFGANSFGGFYRSTDDGVTWSQMNEGLDTSLDIRDMAISTAYPRDFTIFLATGDGVYRSLDGGSTWERKNSGLTVTNARAIVISPAFRGDRTVFVGTDGGGVYQSTDAGESWTEYNTGLSDKSISALTISAAFAKDCTIFAGSGGGSTFLGGTGGTGVFINSCAPSYTKGTWQNISEGPYGTGPLVNLWVVGITTIPYYGLMGCPVSGGDCWESWQIVVATAYNGVWLASQSAPGSNVSGSPWVWSQIDNRDGYLNEFGGREATSLAMSPDYAVGSPSTDERRLLVSSRNGIYSGDFAHFYLKDVTGTVTPTIQPGSEGSGWLRTNNTSPENKDVRSVAMAPDFRHNRTAWEASWGALPAKGIASPGLLQASSGITWTHPADPRLNVFSYVWDLAAIPTAPTQTLLFAGTWGNGVHRSADGGETWNRVAFSSNYTYTTGDSRLPAADYNDVRAVAVSPNYSNDNTVFAGTFGQGVLRSNEAGNTIETWVQGSNQPSDQFIRTLALRPDFQFGNAISQTVYAGTRGGGVHRSLDGGDSWEAINKGLSGDALSTRDIAVSPNFPTEGTMFVGTDAGLFKTTSGLQTNQLNVRWVGSGNRTPGGPVLLLQPGLESAAAMNLPAPPGDDFALNGLAGIMDRLGSGGLTGQALNIVISVALSPAYNEAATARSDNPATTLFAAVWGSGIYRSHDKGSTWTSLTRNNPEVTGLDSTLIRDIVLSPNYGSGTDRTIYAATFDKGLFRSMNNGRTWSRYISDESTIPFVDQRDVATVAVAKAGASGRTDAYTVYAGTAGRGVYTQTAPLPQLFISGLFRGSRQ